MATKTVVLVESDFSGVELTDETHVRVQVKHPDQPGLVELDLSTEEAAKLADTSLRLVEFTIHEPNKPPRTALVETKTLDRLFKGVDLDSVLMGARKVTSPSPAAAPRKRAAAAARPARTDYTSPDHFGQLHRGRVTEDEARLVREDRDRASKNRESQGHPPIDWSDPKEKARYGVK